MVSQASVSLCYVFEDRRPTSSYTNSIATFGRLPGKPAVPFGITGWAPPILALLMNHHSTIISVRVSAHDMCMCVHACTCMYVTCLYTSMRVTACCNLYGLPSCISVAMASPTAALNIAL